MHKFILASPIFACGRPQDGGCQREESTSQLVKINRQQLQNMAEHVELSVICGNRYQC